ASFSSSPKRFQWLFPASTSPSLARGSAPAAHRFAARSKELDRDPDPRAALRLPQRESFRSVNFAKLGRVATKRAPFGRLRAPRTGAKSNCSVNFAKLGRVATKAGALRETSRAANWEVAESTGRGLSGFNSLSRRSRSDRRG